MSADFLIVGIGASAGGIKAFKAFFEQVPADSGLAYVVILHLSPEHESHLAEVLQVSSSIPVAQVNETILVEPNHVYVIPPNRSLSMSDGHLALTELTHIEERRAPIDIFFRTLAETRADSAVSVVLSGTGADGSMGMKRIKERGGVCFVQDPEEAEHGEMPRSSIATGLVDQVLPVREIPGRILAYASRLGVVRVPETAADRRDSDEHALREIFTHLRGRTGHDFSNYKRPTVLRRLERRMNVHQVHDLAEYARLLRERPDEAAALLRDLLISVTNFFRDRPAFDALERRVIPSLFEGKGEDDELRVWVAGCASGEEAYSLAMLIAEHAGDRPGLPRLQIFATDVDERAIATGRAGLYTLNDAADVSPERLRRFFVKRGESYGVRKELRESILFAAHNVLKDPPFSHLDLVSCRNLLIYLNRGAQHRLMDLLHFALNPGGILFLGSSESVEGAADLFATVDKDARLFQARAVSRRFVTPVLETVTRREHDRTRDVGPGLGAPTARFSAGELHQRLLERYAPPSLVVNEEHEIVHVTPGAAKYLQFVGGQPSANLLKTIRPELRLEVRTALLRAAQHRATVEARRLPVLLEDGATVVNVSVRPVLPDEDPARGFFLVVFEPADESSETADAHVVATSGAVEPARQLEEEVVHLKAQLRATTEHHEAQAEELKSSNEELQSLNEELRSTAEELETSREELQSVNEELVTVNQELKIKIEEQTQANDDFQNLINSTDIGTIFLDRGTHIKLFTPRARDVFKMIPSDAGRPLADIASQLVDVDVLAEVDRVLDRLERVEREVQTQDGRWHLMRVLPYRTREDRIEGVILTFLDVTQRLKAQRESLTLRTSLEEELSATTRLHEVSTWLLPTSRLQALLESLLTAAVEIQGAEAGTVHLYNQHSDGLELAAHRGFSDTIDVVAVASGEQQDTPWRRAISSRERIIIEDSESSEVDGRTRKRIGPLGYRALLATPLLDRSGAPLGVLSTYASQAWRPSERQVRLADLYARQAAEMISLRLAEAALREADRRKNDFLATLAHELRNPLAPVSTGIDVLMLAGGQNPATRDVLEAMRRQVDQMVRLIDDLTEVSRITLGKIRLRRGRVDLVEMLRNAIESTRPLLEAHGQRFSATLPPQQVTVDGDGVRLTQVFANLLNNAAKYTPFGGDIKLSVSIDGERVSVSVRDSGVGIEAEMLPRVFDMFAQADSTLRSMPGGLGIGLTLARHLVTLHQGTIEAQSAGVGQGSEFTVRLPLATDKTRPVSRVEMPPSAPPRRRVLVVDDNRDAADGLRALVTRLGSEARVAYDGASALSMIDSYRPMLVILDVGMPELAGDTVARLMRERSDALLVALTGWAGTAAMQFRADAFDRVVTKPIDSVGLRQLLTEAPAETRQAHAPNRMPDPG